MSQPRLLDLFCGAGISATGWAAAGFDVTGVDIRPQKRYPYAFIQDDAIAYALAYGWQYDAIAASPPCQFGSQITPKHRRDQHPNLIPQTRFALESLGKPYMLENVGGNRKRLRNPLMLCGAQFGLKVYRHRFFESNVLLFQPEHQPHRDNTPRAGHGISEKGFISVTSGGKTIVTSSRNRKPSGARHTGTRGISENGFVSVCGHITGADYCRLAMGIGERYVSAAELVQGYPPQYAEYLGRQLMAYVLERQVTP